MPAGASPGSAFMSARLKDPLRRLPQIMRTLVVISVSLYGLDVRLVAMNASRWRAGPGGKEARPMAAAFAAIVPDRSAKDGPALLGSWGGGDGDRARALWDRADPVYYDLRQAHFPVALSPK